MLRHLLRRMGHALLTLLAVSILIHAALDIAPGDAADALVGDFAGQAQTETLRRELGLDLPFLTRYVDYASGILLKGDWGQSMMSGRAVANLLAARLPNSLLLAATPMGIATLIGGALGIAAACRAGGPVDTLVIAASAVAMASPSYWTALILLWLFALKLNWLPVLSGNGLRHLILPALTLAIPLAASVSRFMRAHVVQELSARYVQTAQAKGASQGRVVFRHVLPNALSSVLTLLGLQFGHLIGGTFIVETIYGWPGLGGLMVQAIFDRDHPVVMGTGMLIAASYITINLLTDLLHRWADPRVSQVAH